MKSITREVYDFLTFVGAIILYCIIIPLIIVVIVCLFGLAMAYDAVMKVLKGKG